MTRLTDIDTLVSQFVTDLKLLMKRKTLEQVVAAIQVGEMPASRRAATKPTGKRIRRSSEDLAHLGEKLLAHVRANPGQRGEQVAAALRMDVTTIRPAMHKLIASNQVRTEGQKRGMTYQPGRWWVEGGGSYVRGQELGERPQEAREVALRVS